MEVTGDIAMQVAVSLCFTPTPFPQAEKNVKMSLKSISLRPQDRHNLKTEESCT